MPVHSTIKSNNSSPRMLRICVRQLKRLKLTSNYSAGRKCL